MLLLWTVSSQLFSTEPSLNENKMAVYCTQSILRNYTVPWSRYIKKLKHSYNLSNATIVLSRKETVGSYLNPDINKQHTEGGGTRH